MNERDKEWKLSYLTVAVIQLTITFCLLNFLRGAFLEVSYIPSGSMQPTLTEGSIVLGLKASDSITYDDLVIFCPDLADQSTKYLKRVVGLPGDTVEVADGQLIRNGNIVSCEYTKDERINYVMPKLVLTEDEYFVMGDNRNNSEDSHIFGPISTQQIIAHAIYYIRYTPEKISDCQS